MKFRIPWDTSTSGNGTFFANHTCNQVKFSKLSPNFQTENAPSILSCNMHHPSSSESKKTHEFTPVRTLICGVSADVLSVPHQANHVSRWPLIPGSAQPCKGVAPQQSNQPSTRWHGHRPPPHIGVDWGRGQHGDNIHHHRPSSQLGGCWPVVPLPLHEGMQPRIGRQAHPEEDPQIWAEVLDSTRQAGGGAATDCRTQRAFSRCRQTTYKQTRSGSSTCYRGTFTVVHFAPGESDQLVLQRRRL